MQTRVNPFLEEKNFEIIHTEKRLIREPSEPRIENDDSIIRQLSKEPVFQTYDCSDRGLPIINYENEKYRRSSSRLSRDQQSSFMSDFRKINNIDSNVKLYSGPESFMSSLKPSNPRISNIKQKSMANSQLYQTQRKARRREKSSSKDEILSNEFLSVHENFKSQLSKPRKPPK